MSVRIVAPPADIFASGADAIVVPVNAVGTCGKGLAQEAAKRWREWEHWYRASCQRGELLAGGMLAYDRTIEESDQWVIDGDPRWTLAIATKAHWRDTSQLEWVVSGVGRLAEWARNAEPASVAVCALGCGLGGLRFDDVRPRIVERLGGVRGVEFLVYAPHEAPVTRPQRGRRGGRSWPKG